ncbi:hypothetical protein PC9H_010233 [Pleurotus ostreatus]|uniref:T6SS Phospholipase effector Tle1-like catalytic domain-containing protein n=1 Tax=Pleurotus ostreatus TaxID=5322 RepID=A0A8H6ZQK5_PLEOS|nr:uncharacterized protein PC9H_010233 [Pleurotus ostreatus]KAF7424922.1 hypothetical protein PC9H_010233 [Pleurotus ostreatus]KAJ8692049.1 hypothetical protein PTI98_009390 [Pleurotus ostreatus]
MNTSRPPQSTAHSVIGLIAGATSVLKPRSSRHQADSKKGIQDPTPASEIKGKEICCPSNGKNICVSADGTLGEFGEKNSNVVELHSRIIKDEKQLTYYISGIGTYSDSDIRRWWDSAVAASFQRNVLKAYEWLCNNYEPGDRIFLFGFSRGAYQVRVIAGMIERVGLLYKGNNSQLPSVLKLYMKAMEEPASQIREDDLDQTSTEGLSEVEKQCRIFKNAFSQPGVKVHFVGAWDTVSSVGIRREPCLPETTNGMGHVCHFRHALALDERRVRFWPEHASSSAHASSGGDVKEVWFAGCHSDIGGWSTLNKELDSFGPALRWMTYEAMNNGLRMHQHTKGWAPLTPSVSLVGFWHIFEYLPLHRPSYKRGTSRRLHNGAPRRILDGQRIHKSVFEAMGIDTDELLSSSLEVTNSAGPSEETEAPTVPQAYKPLARFYDEESHTWDDIRRLVEERLEDDPFASADFAVRLLKGAADSDDTRFEAAIGVLKGHVLFSQSQAIGGPGSAFSERQGLKPLAEVSADVSDFLLLTLEKEVGRKQNRRAEVITVLLLALAIVPPNHKAQPNVSVFRNIAAALQDDGSWKSTYRQVVRHHVNKPLVKVAAGQQRSVEYVGFSSHNEDFVFTGSYGAIVIWDCKTQQRITTLRFSSTNCRDVRSVEISEDGLRCASGHADGSVRWWNIETGDSLLKLKPEGTIDRVRTVTLSSDGTKIASGSVGGIIRIWATETGKDLHGPMKGHGDWINEVVFSPDGSRLASGSDDHTIRLWDTSNGKQLKVMEGHTHDVWSVAFSPSGDQIISGSYDKTIRIWETESGKMTKMLEGHTQWVYYAAFSPTQTFVASGSGDGTVRVWDQSTGETLAVYKAGNPVRSVAFSSDGKKIISGCDNGDVHIWDAGLLI